MLIIGSHALNAIDKSRHPADLDIIIPYNKVTEIVSEFTTSQNYKGRISKQDENMVILATNSGRVELLIARPESAFWKYLEKYDAFEVTRVMDAQGLFSLKKSHVHIPIKFDKHIRDYCTLNKIVGGVDTMTEITKQNTEDIKKRLNRHFKSPSLNKSVKEFFAQSEGKVKSFFIHDNIHEVMAHYERPLYEKMQKDLTMAKCEKDLWEQFSYEDKVKCVLEEAYVIALERKILPVLYGGERQYFSPQNALTWAMMRVCTTLTGGWFRKFATENYVEIMDTAKKDKFSYVEKFLKSVDSGTIPFVEQKQVCSTMA